MIISERRGLNMKKDEKVYYAICGGIWGAAAIAYAVYLLIGKLDGITLWTPICFLIAFPLLALSRKILRKYLLFPLTYVYGFILMFYLGCLGVILGSNMLMTHTVFCVFSIVLTIVFYFPVLLDYYEIYKIKYLVNDLEKLRETYEASYYDVFKFGKESYLSIVKHLYDKYHSFTYITNKTGFNDSIFYSFLESHDRYFRRGDNLYYAALICLKLVSKQSYDFRIIEYALIRLDLLAGNFYLKLIDLVNASRFHKKEHEKYESAEYVFVSTWLLKFYNKEVTITDIADNLTVPNPDYNIIPENQRKYLEWIRHIDEEYDIGFFKCE